MTFFSNKNVYYSNISFLGHHGKYALHARFKAHLFRSSGNLVSWQRQLCGRVVNGIVYELCNRFILATPVFDGLQFLNWWLQTP